MSKLFGNLSNNSGMQRQALESRYLAARSNLLLVVIFTAVNMLILVTNGGSYFLFSASVPYILTSIGMYLCGMYPAEYYPEGGAGMVFAPQGLFVLMLVISIIILAMYLLCWIFTKKHRVGPMIFALVLFGIDTLVMFWFYGLRADDIPDIAFHIWVIVILAMGIGAHYKLKKLPPEDVIIEGEFTEIDPEGGELSDGEADSGINEPKKIPDTVALRPADTDVKARIFLETDAYGHVITYRRVKRTNELVIDGDVYDEYTALVEQPHILTATLDGHSFAAGTDNTSHTYILIDGQTVKTKLRVV